jgi:hypothetical protein
MGTCEPAGGTTQGQAIMRKIILAASAALVAFSGAAVARDAMPASHHVSAVIQQTSEQTGAVDMMDTGMAADAHHYHGGPKAND